MKRSSGWAVLAIGVALAVSGCAGGPGGSVVGEESPTPSQAPTPTPSPSRTAEPGLKAPLVAVTDPAILAYCPPGTPEHFDGDVAAVSSITMCTVDEVESTRQTAATAVQRAGRVETGADALLEAYAEPNAVATDGSCIALAADPLIVWLTVDAGPMPVYAPVDECGFPTDAAAAAYNGVTLTTLAESSGGAVAPVDPGD